MDLSGFYYSVKFQLKNCINLNFLSIIEKNEYVIYLDGYLKTNFYDDWFC